MKIGCIAVTCLFGSGVSAFSTIPSSSYQYSTRRHSLSTLPLLYADRQTTDTFAAFADSLEQEEPESDDESWQERLESLLLPSTPLAQRQILISELLSSNQEIRDSVSTALRDRKVIEMFID
jgi:phosphatidylserine/phosphatidylglycerophosphate/cardiolipin synthase-like enzyme